MTCIIVRGISGEARENKDRELVDAGRPLNDAQAVELASHLLFIQEAMLPR